MLHGRWSSTLDLRLLEAECTNLCLTPYKGGEQHCGKAGNYSSPWGAPAPLDRRKFTLAKGSRWDYTPLPF